MELKIDNVMNRIYSLNKIIVCLFVMMPVVESINGYFYGSGISDIYRFLTVMLIAYYFILGNRYNSEYFINFLILLSIFLFILTCQFLFFHQDQKIALYGLKSIFRILLAPFYFSYFYDNISLGYIERNDIRKIIYIYGILYSMLVILPYLGGSGFVSYDNASNSLTSRANEINGIGNKGFFIELNSLVAILSANLFFCRNVAINYFYRNRIGNALLGVFLYIIILFSLFVTATKFGILFSIICSIIFITQVGRCNLSRKIKIFIFLFFILVSTILYLCLKDLMIDVFTRLSYFSTRNNNVLDFITSNRTSYLTEAFNEVDKSKFKYFIYCFGAGYSSSFQPAEIAITRSITEIDIFDFFLSYGFTGLISYVYFFWNELLFSFNNKSVTNGMLIILLIYSFAGGHVLVNSMTATYLALLFSYTRASKLSNNL